MKIGFYFSGPLKPVNKLCLDRLVEFSKWAGLPKPLCYTHEDISTNPYGEEFEYKSADVLAPYFYAIGEESGLTMYEECMRRKQWMRFNDIMNYFGSFIEAEQIFKLDADIYIVDFNKFHDYILYATHENLDVMFWDCDTRGPGVEFLNVHMSIFQPDSKLTQRISDIMNHAKYCNQMLDHYNYIGPHLMNYMIYPMLMNSPFKAEGFKLISSKPDNGYTKDLVRQFSDSGDITIFKDCTYVHLVGSQLTDWLDGTQVTYNDRKNIWKG